MTLAAVPGDVATATVYVAVAPADAFEVFTAEIDQWWRQGPAYRIAGRRRGQLRFEPGVGGKLTETVETSAGPRTYHVGEITAWEPPARLAMIWRGVNFAPGQATTVEVSFRAQGEGTLVTVRHAGWSTLPAGHPARHGLEGAAFARMMGLWWAGLATALREHVATTRGATTG